MGTDPSPNHDGASAKCCHLLDEVFVVPVSSELTHAYTAVIVLQAESGLAREEHQSPLLTCEADVTRTSGSAGSLVGKGELGGPHWTPGVVLGSMHVVANSLSTDVGVSSCPQLPPGAGCSGSSHCLSLSCDPTISSC
jgi:hypothetical protein